MHPHKIKGVENYQAPLSESNNIFHIRSMCGVYIVIYCDLFIVILVYVFYFHARVNVYKSDFDLGQNYLLPSLAQFRNGLAQIQIPNRLSLLIKGF